MLHLPFLEMLLMSAVTCKQKVLHEKRLYNIFKTKNAIMMLTNDLLEIPYRVL